MKSLVKIISLTFSLLIILYLLLPNPDFPEPPRGSLQSFEPADTETSLRRGYFTDLSREKVMEHYIKQFSKAEPLGISIPTYRLNYPPEEAQVIIRDQTQSTFLEEIVHPLRESLYVNGFEPFLDKDAIVREEKEWRQKITVRLVPSSVFSRVLVVGLGLTVFWLILNEFTESVLNLFKRRKND